MAITRHEDGSVIITAPHTVGMFQLVQWKHAIKLEAIGIKVARRSVTAHAKRVLGIKGPMNREDLIAHIQNLIDAYMEAHPADEGEAIAVKVEPIDGKSRAAGEKED